MYANQVQTSSSSSDMIHGVDNVEDAPLEVSSKKGHVGVGQNQFLQRGHQMYPRSNQLQHGINSRGKSKPSKQFSSQQRPHPYKRNGNKSPRGVEGRGGGPHGRQFNPARPQNGDYKSKNGGFRNDVQNYFYGQLQQVKQPSFYCCPCERGFKTQELLDEHTKEHVVCGLDGCKFVAHYLVVTKHIRMQHKGNLFERIKNLTTPEDISKWREERKKNYPTVKIIEENGNKKKEKDGRKEVTSSAAPSTTPGIFRYKIQHQQSNRETSYNEYQQGLRQLRNSQKYDWRFRTYAPDPKSESDRVPFFSMNESKMVSLENFYMQVTVNKDGNIVKKDTKVRWKGFRVRKLERLGGSDSADESDHHDDIPISDDEDCCEAESDQDDSATNTEVIKSDSKTQDQSKGNPSLGLMLIDYSSASESENEEDSCEALPKNISSPVEQNEINANHESTILQSCEVGTSSEPSDSIKDSVVVPNDDDDYNSDSSTQSMIIDEFEDELIRKPVYTKSDIRSPKKWKRTRFIETLLQDQIRKERNTIIQACRFITENDFFEGS